MRHYLLVEAFLLVSDFSKWPPMNIVLMCYTFGEIREMEKKCINTQSPKTSFDVKLIQGNRLSTNNSVNTFSLLKIKSKHIFFNV